MRPATTTAGGLIQIGETEYAVEESINEQTGDPQGWLLLNLTNGSVYEVRAGPQPTCTCDDYICRRKRESKETCKHIRFFFPPPPEPDPVETEQEPAPLEVGNWAEPEGVEALTWPKTPPNRLAETLFVRLMTRRDIDPLTLEDDQIRHIASRCLWIAGLFEVEEERIWECGWQGPVRLREERAS